MSPRTLLAPLLVGLVVLTTLGCETTDDRVIQTDIPFRAEGYLDFIRPDGKRITDARIAIEIAEGDSARGRGLMDRRCLPSRGGMLFLDDEPQMQSFWMKSTPMPLDILFIDENNEIVNIVKRTVPYSDDRILSTDSALYVLEVRSGFVDRFRITDDHTISWLRQDMVTEFHCPD